MSIFTIIAMASLLQKILTNWYNFLIIFNSRWRRKAHHISILQQTNLWLRTRMSVFTFIAMAFVHQEIFANFLVISSLRWSKETHAISISQQMNLRLRMRMIIFTFITMASIHQKIFANFHISTSSRWRTRKSRQSSIWKQMNLRSRVNWVMRVPTRFALTPPT